MRTKILTPRKLSTPLKIRMTNFYVFSILIYVAETCTLTKPLEKNIGAFEIWCWVLETYSKNQFERESEKRGPTATTTRQSLQTVKQEKLHYCRHIGRTSNSLTTLIEQKMGGRRSRGRPRQSWFSNITQQIGGDTQISCITKVIGRNLQSHCTSTSRWRWYFQVSRYHCKKNNSRCLQNSDSTS